MLLAYLPPFSLIYWKNIAIKALMEIVKKKIIRYFLTIQRLQVILSKPIRNLCNPCLGQNTPILQITNKY